jgi:hypothetical protein
MSALIVVLEEMTSKTKTGLQMPIVTTEKLNGGSYIRMVDLQHLVCGYEKIRHIVKLNTHNELKELRTLFAILYSIFHTTFPFLIFSKYCILYLKYVKLLDTHTCGSTLML